jgi:ABC-2 type transport system permease protein
VIADVKQPFTDAEMINYNDYLSSGGNIMIAAEPGRQAEMASLLQPLGVELVPGTLLQPKKQNLPELNFGQPSPLLDSLSYLLNGTGKQKRAALVFNKAVALKYNTGAGFNVFPLATTDSITWNELQTTDFVNDSARFDPASGEQKKVYTTALALSRNQNNRQQRILVTGDADWLSTGELTRKRERVRPINFMFLFGAFHYLSDEELPVDMRRDPSTDNEVKLKKADWERMETMAIWGFPSILLLSAIWLLMRRKGR